MSCVRYGQRGYAGQSKSWGAIRAENGGLLPLTRAVREVAEQAGCTVSFARECLKRVGPTEWHHTGKFAQQTHFYETYKAARMAGIFFGAERRAALAAAAGRRETARAWREHAERMVARELALVAEARVIHWAAEQAERDAERAIVRRAYMQIEAEALRAKPTTPERAERLAYLTAALGGEGISHA